MTKKTKTPEKAPDENVHKIDPTRPDLWKGDYRKIGGSQNDPFNLTLGDQVIKTIFPASDHDERQMQLDAAIGSLSALKPRDEIEGMLIAQLVGSHNAAMECLRRAMIANQSFEGRAQNLAFANKLSRTYAALVETLNKHRGKGGKQSVTVKHVHVHGGGQAIVGNVSHVPGGAGPNSKSEEQPHAQVAHAPQPAMRSANPQLDVLSGASHAERPMSHAWGSLNGRAAR